MSDIRLAFCGKMKSGKDTAANHLKNLKGGTTIHVFAAGYRFVELLLCYWLVGAKIDPDKKSKFERLMLQWVGHWGRVLFGKDIWLNRTIKMIAKTKGNVFVTGVRYPNEIARLKAIGVQSVWIDRPLPARLQAGAFNLGHETEIALDNFTGFDFKIPNDKDLATFLRRVECYGHIDKIASVVEDAQLTRASRVAQGLPATQENVMFMDDGVERGWKPEDPNYTALKEARAKATEELRLEMETRARSFTNDELTYVSLAMENEKAERRLGVGYFSRYDVDSHEIAQEIRRFADLVNYNLKVADGKEAVASVRKTLHSILDNRGIAGETEAKQETSRTREETLAEIQRLAATIGEELVSLDDVDTIRRVKNALLTEAAVEVAKEVKLGSFSRAVKTSAKTSAKVKATPVKRAKKAPRKAARKSAKGKRK